VRLQPGVCRQPRISNQRKLRALSFDFFEDFAL